jgi:hypothetical protein
MSSRPRAIGTPHTFRFASFSHLAGCGIRRLHGMGGAEAGNGSYPPMGGPEGGDA